MIVVVVVIPIVIVVVVMIVLPAIAVPVVVMVPAVVVFKAAAVAIPIAREISLAVVMRRDPMRTRIGWTRPVARVPLIVMPDGIPVAFHPHEIGPGSGWNYRQHARRWRRSDLDSDGNLCVRYRSPGEQKRANQQNLANRSADKR